MLRRSQEMCDRSGTLARNRSYWCVEVSMSEEPNEIASQGEYEPSSRNTVAIGVALLLLGFAAGAIAAALMTPKSGKQLRRSLRRKLDDARDAVGDLTE